MSLIERNPLVSIIIPNRNHSKYLGQSIESALAQTYKNIEIVVNDNCSDDNSLEVAMRYLDRGVLVNKNPINIFADNYRVLSYLVRGEYFMVLCADDIIKPTFIERAVNIMEKYNNVGYVHCERDYIDDKGNVTELDPFFNCNFVAQGESMLPIYMLSEVGQAAQGLIRHTVFEKAGEYDTESDHSCIDREQWFRLSMISDYAYIREKLALIRVHNASATSAVADSFLHPILLYLTVKEFADWGEICDYPEVLLRKERAYKKLASDFLSYAIRYLKQKQFSLAKQYLLFIRLLDNNTINDKSYNLCMKMCISEDLNNMSELNVFAKDIYAPHTRNYNPPEGFIVLEEEFVNV